MQNQKTIYLHIGSDSQTTKQIQQFLYNNEVLLHQYGYFYPEIRDDFVIKGYSNMATLFRKITMTLKNVKISSFKDIKYRWKRYYTPVINNSTDQNIILSSNDIEDYFPDLYKFLTEEGFEVKIVIYIKKPAEYVTDLWCNEIIKNKNSEIFLHPVTYFTKEKNNIYDGIIKILSNVPRNNIIIRPYELSQMKDNSLIEDFLNSIGIEITEKLNNIKNNNLDYNANELALINFANLLKFETNYINEIKEFVNKTHKNEENLNCINILSDKQIEKITNFYIPKIEEIQQLVSVNQLFLNVFPDNYQNKKTNTKEISFTKSSLDVLFSLIEKNKTNQNKKKKFLYIRGKSSFVLKLFKFYFKFDIKK